MVAIHLVKLINLMVRLKDGKVEWSANPKTSTNCKVVKIFSIADPFLPFSQNTNLGVLYIGNHLRKVFVLDSYILMPTKESRIVKYACVIWLFFLIGHLYLNGVWSSETLQTNIIRTDTFQKDWTWYVVKF